MFKPKLWLMNLCTPKSKMKSEANTLALTQRTNRVAESILENERLTADLDDATAQVLLDWGIACAKVIVQSTTGLDDTEAEEAMYPRLRATRRLMRLVNRWIPKRLNMESEDHTAQLTKIIEQAEVIYGEGFTPPGNEQQEAFLHRTLADSPPQIVKNLRTLIEKSQVEG